MPITLLDALLLVVMLISGLLAMVRGFMREILSIAAWIVAAIAALTVGDRLIPLVRSLVDLGHTAVQVIAAAMVFLVVLFLVSIITVRVSDMVLDSRVGALDRTLGLLFGLGRGLIIVVVAYIFFDWLVPVRSQPNWVKDAKSVVILKSTGDWIEGLLPEGLDDTIFRRLRRHKLQEPNTSGGDQHSQLPLKQDKTGRRG